ncbi:unnamed protein product [Linum tenue]|uniref:FAF domain-containing protein n=1 Tax=Linum tenue TaxID=586396 RepID=A0AAV0RR03_9ROSI|nr:unnamed protein product [Linum tenue]
MAEPRTLRLRLSARKPSHHSLELSLKPSESGGWSFLQTLSESDPTPPSSPILKPASPPYAAKRSSLSDKSLQLCTENLGSETGSDSASATDDDRNYLFSPSPPREAGPQPESNSPTPTTAVEASRPAAARRDFPPPLTTMRGPELVRLRRPHREGGRLVIEAVKCRSQPSCFEAERIDGRLRLHVVRDSSEFDSSSSSVTASEKIAEGNGEILSRREGEERMTESESSRRRNNRYSNTAWRCVAGGGQYDNKNGKGLFNWEPFWAATASLQV